MKTPTIQFDQKVDLSPIQAFLDLATARLNPLEIWLFGSRAEGRAKLASDWDFLFVLPDEKIDEELADIHLAWRLRRQTGANVDLALCGISDFQADSLTPNTLAYEVVRKGIRVYSKQ